MKFCVNIVVILLVVVVALVVLNQVKKEGYGGHGVWWTRAVQERRNLHDAKRADRGMAAPRP